MMQDILFLHSPTTYDIAIRSSSATILGETSDEWLAAYVASRSGSSIMYHHAVASGDD